MLRNGVVGPLAAGFPPGMADLIIGLMQPNPSMRMNATALSRHSLLTQEVIYAPGTAEGSPVQALYRQAVQQEHAQLATQCEAVRQRTAANAIELKRLQCLKQFFEDAVSAQLSSEASGDLRESNASMMRESSDLDIDL